MTTNNEELRALLAELKLRTPPDTIANGEQEGILAFLRQEQTCRRDYRMKQLLRGCGIRPAQMRTFEQFDWNFNPKIPKQDILAFRRSPWMRDPNNLILIGDPGLGKSHIAKSLCYDAILAGASAYFITAFDLVSKITKAHNPAAKIDFYGKVVKVLCLDELGYTVHSRENVDILFQIISKRAEILPTIVTTNLVPKQWGTIFSGPAASATLDRLSYNGTFITMEGQSYRSTLNRKKQKR